MHIVTISLQGAANDSASIELGDSEALPVYVKLKEVISGTKVPKKVNRREAAGNSEVGGVGVGHDSSKGSFPDLEAER